MGKGCTLRNICFFLFAMSLSVSGVSAQSNETVAYVQEALQELGYDPGTADGAWGRRTRKALNEYRATLDLPETEDVTGSSLYLLHRKVSAGQTLPHPGRIVEGLGDRAEYLQVRGVVRERQCNNRLNLQSVGANWTPVTRFSETDVSFAAPSPIGGADWSGKIAEGLSVITADCISGDAAQCDVLWSYLKKWPAANGLTTTAKKVENSEKFNRTAFLANSVLQPLVFATGVVIETQDPEMAELAPVLDWLYDRVNQFYFISDKNTLVGDSNNTLARHEALAAVLPSMTLGALMGDVELFERGFPQFEAALLSQRADGSFPTATRRGSLALHYSGLQLSYLFAIAEIAKSQDFDLYEVEWPKGQDLHRAITYMLRGWSNWGKHVLKYAGDNVDAPMTPSSAFIENFTYGFGWLPIYGRRFENHPNLSLMNGVSVDPVVCSPSHIAEGRIDRAWCVEAGPPPLSLRAMLLDNSKRVAVFNPAMGFNGGCFLSQSEDLF